MFVKNSTGVLRRVLLSPPDYLEAAPINEIARKWSHTGLDHDKMATEFQLLKDAYTACNVVVEELPAAPDRPNATFARDFGACIREGYLLGRFRRSIRFPERAAYQAKMESLGIPMVGVVREGLFEGGDVFFLDDETLVFGMLDRTDAPGLAELRALLEPLGYHVLGVPGNPAYLHLDMCFNLITPRLAVGCPEALPEEFHRELRRRDIVLIPTPEESIFQHGCNLQSLGGDRVLSLAQNHRVNEALERHGVTVIKLDITETLKAGGGPHCMTFPLERA